MKAVVATALLAALGVLAGCGVGMRGGPPPVTFTITGTTTMPHVKTGVAIRCKGGAQAQVPSPGGAVAVGEDELVTGTRTGPPLGEIQLTHRREGSVTASCKQ